MCINVASEYVRCPGHTYILRVQITHQGSEPGSEPGVRRYQPFTYLHPDVIRDMLRQKAPYRLVRPPQSGPKDVRVAGGGGEDLVPEPQHSSEVQQGTWWVGVYDLNAAD